MALEPQTSGLLTSVEAADAQALEQALREAGVPAALIGRVRPEAKPPIVVL